MEKPLATLPVDVSSDEFIVPYRQRGEAALAAGDAGTMLSIADELEKFDFAEAHTNALLYRSKAATVRGELAQALAYAEEAADIADLAGLHQQHMDCLSFAGATLWRMGHLPRAVAVLERGLGYAELYLPDANRSTIYGNLGLVYAAMGEYPTSVDYLQRLLDIDDNPLAKLNAALAHLNLGSVYGAAGDSEKALDHLQMALVVFREKNHERATIGCLMNMAPILGTLQRSDECLAVCIEAVDRSVEIGDATLIPGCLHALASTYLAASDIASAQATLDRLNMHRPLPPVIEVGALLLYGNIHLLNDELVQARVAFEAAMVLAQEHGCTEPLARAYKSLVDVCKKQSDFDGYVRYNELCQKTEEDLRGAAVQRKLVQQSQQRELQAQREQIDLHRNVVRATLPDYVAERVMRGERVLDELPHVAVLFSDVAGFTSVSATMPSSDLVQLLSSLFERFDAVVAKYGALKIKTIGDAYMCIATGESTHEACSTLARIALELSSQHFTWPDGRQLRLRFGMHVGPATAGVIGTERLQYDVWGDTVNVASRMESTGEPGRIHVSGDVARALASEWTFTLVSRGLTLVKGKGVLNTYWLEHGSHSINVMHATQNIS